jgi:hypothetical protein
MNTQPDMKPADAPAPARRPYVKPAIQRVDLALEETLSAGCKMVDGCGSDLFDPEGGLAGS